MTEQIVVYVKDMGTFLEPDEYQKFLKAKEEVEEYQRRRSEYEKKKADAESARDECQKRKDEAKTDAERSAWDSERFIFMMEALMPAPYYPAHYFYQHDSSIKLVRERKLKQIEEEQRQKAEEEAERQREEEGKQREQQMMVAAIRRKVAADSEWQQFQNTFRSTIKELKHQLANPKPPKFALGCSPEVLSYHPELWCDLNSPSDVEVKGWAQPQILEKIPELLQPFVTFALTPGTFVIPKVEYQLSGIPCLVWHFDIYVAARVDLWVKETTITKEFHGWKYVAPIKVQKIGSFFLKAQFWDSQEGFETPIALLALLVEDKLEAPGITIEYTMNDPVSTIYTVMGFEEHRLEHYYIEVREEFRRFIVDICKNQSLGQGLLVRGIVGGETAKLIEAKWDEPLPVSGKLGNAGGLDLESVVAKLVELGWTQADAKKAVETTTFPNNATTEEMVSIILQKSY